MYLSYGSGPHVEETIFSILTACRWLHERRDIQIVVYTDRSEGFDLLPVKIRKLSQEELFSWQGAAGYLHRRKTCAILDALNTLGGNIVFVDSDTWFRRSPEILFERIGPGRTCLHLRELLLRKSQNPAHLRLCEIVRSKPFRDISGKRRHFSRNLFSWNSGVVGINAADAFLMEDALLLIDDIWGQFQEAHDVEQFATMNAFCKNTNVSEASDIVFHYWPTYLRLPFRDQLPDLLVKPHGNTAAEWGDAVFEFRPRAVGARRLRIAIRDCLWRLGLRQSSVRSNG
jgi:hypothetical protein